ncbi:hypothetical protein ANCCEY_10657 [Ancylostoma ceylanicum]|uniref:Amino acid permease/ SLC12A domain-containing protein n=1 Tax=Ancylostoma ceylanicum TaxID=53326 RepID=A0A0D6LRH2_9BILA|nr:hypothetical protein ANCCEY_10657 [Ancylostoma ceylanicum]
MAGLDISREKLSEKAKLVQWLSVIVVLGYNMTRKEVNRLGLFGATSYIVGSVIGSGIFVSPKGILEHAGSVGLSLIIWVAAAVLASLTAINYIELGTSIPESGAEFAYVSYVGWYPIAFSFLWLATLIQWCSC